MKKRNKTIIIIIAAFVLAGIGFTAGMLAKSSMAQGSNITMEEAKQIALASVGVTAEKATFTKEEFDEGSYEIDFYTGTNEYDFKIDADPGAITEREVSPRDLSLPEEQGNNNTSQSENNQQQTTPTQAPAQTNNDDSVIGVAAAKEIALNHAGVSNASFIEAQLDYDDGIRIYDVEFTAGNRTYDYDINAITGDIITYDVDYVEYDDDGYDD